MGKEVARSLQQQRPFALFHFFKVHVSMMARQPGDLLRGEPARFHQLFQADQQRIAGKGRKRGVGRIAVAGWVQRKNLPQPLFGRGQKISKGIGSRTKVADATVRRQ
jgi:hypothetical protein